ncbi:hypothetical protein CCMA1212_007237 [Trichoderma ghanense]|uniref:Uncharacterized protein n=1 Tax=Trichoderma ghanense TaxID=65468 RepID=A0ABY2GYH8_9HYPO
MQLSTLPPNSGNMAQAPDHGGLHYVELIKSNLQFVHGKDCLFEVLSQVKAPDTWQVSVLKTDVITPRCVILFDSGPSLVEVLAKLHRRSAEMLATFLAGNAADASAYAKYKKVEALALPQKNELPKKEVERSRNGVEKPPQAEDEVKPADAIDAAARAVGSPDSQMLHLRATSPPLVKTRRGNAAPCRFRGWRSPSPPREEDFEPVSRYEDSSLRPRGFICPNYGPASAFYRVPDGRNEAYWPNAMPPKAPEHRAEVSKPDAGNSVSPPAPASAASLSTATALAQSQPQSSQAEDMAQVKHIDKSNVLLYISWPSYGETIVADQCELSVRSLQSHVRHMLRSHGPALFGDALSGAEPPIVFGPDEAASFAVLIKGLRVNGQVVMLGPAFGDDLGQVVAGRKAEGAIRVEVELVWKGRDLRAGEAK